MDWTGWVFVGAALIAWFWVSRELSIRRRAKKVREADARAEAQAVEDGAAVDGEWHLDRAHKRRPQ